MFCHIWVNELGYMGLYWIFMGLYAYKIGNLHKIWHERGRHGSPRAHTRSARSYGNYRAFGHVTFYMFLIFKFMFDQNRQNPRKTQKT